MWQEGLEDTGGVLRTLSGKFGQEGGFRLGWAGPTTMDTPGEQSTSVVCVCLVGP